MADAKLSALTSAGALDGTEEVYVNDSGASKKTTLADIKSYADSYVAVPASAAATGTAGQRAYDSSYFYVCIATDTWARASLSEW